NRKRLALIKPDALIMHPGPINRGVEIDSEIADCHRSVIPEQVTNRLIVEKVRRKSGRRDDPWKVWLPLSPTLSTDSKHKPSRKDATKVLYKRLQSMRGEVMTVAYRTC